MRSLRRLLALAGTASLALGIVPMVHAGAADSTPVTFLLRGVGAGSYETVDKCCTFVINRLVEGGTSYSAGAMTLQRNVATAAPQWPGELVVGGGGLIGFASNGAVAVPDPPGFARATTPGPSDAATQTQPSNGVGAGAASAHSDAQNQKADAILASADSDSQGERTESHLVQQLSANTATTTVTSAASNIAVNALHVGSVTVTAAWSAGQPGRAEVVVGNCTVGPVPCTIDESGVHLQAGASPVDLKAAQHALDVMKAAGTRVYVGGTSVDTATATAAATGVIVENVTKDPTGDTETSQKVYGYAAASSTATFAPGSEPAAAPLSSPPPPGTDTGIGTSDSGVGLGNASPASSDYPGLPAPTGGTATAALAAPTLPLASEAARHTALLSRMSSGSIVWMALGALLWLITVGTKWVVADEHAAPAEP